MSAVVLIRVGDLEDEAQAIERRFCLGHRGDAIPLAIGECLIGRGSECEIVVIDTLVSRRHAALDVSATGVRVRDLGSRNGVRVNGVRIAEPTELRLGDCLTVGVHDYVLLDRGQSLIDSRVVVAGRAAGHGLDATRPANAVSLLVAVAEQAVLDGDELHAERVVRSLVPSIKNHVRRHGAIERDLLTATSQLALSLADRTGRIEFIDLVFEIYRDAGGLLDLPVVDQIEALATRLGYRGSPAFHAYVEDRRTCSGEFTTFERFLLSRLQRLARTLATD